MGYISLFLQLHKKPGVSTKKQLTVTEWTNDKSGKTFSYKLQYFEYVTAGSAGELAVLDGSIEGNWHQGNQEDGGWVTLKNGPGTWRCLQTAVMEQEDNWTVDSRRRRSSSDWVWERFPEKNDADLGL